MKNPIHRFFQAALTPIEAVQVILSNKKIFALSLLPILIGIILLGVLVAAWWFALFPWIQTLLAGISFGDVLSGIAGIITFVAMIFLFAFAFPVLVGLIGSPIHFYISELTERTQQSGNNTLDTNEDMGFFNLRRTWEDIKVTLLILLFGMLFGLFFMIPVLGWLSYPGIVGLLAFSYLYYPMEKRGFTMTQCLGWISSHIPETLGLGIVLSLGFSVPVLNILLSPVAVVSGALVFVKR